MSDTTMVGGLVQTWVPVTDEDGRTRLEAHWVEGHWVEAHWVEASSAPTHATHAA